MTTVTGSVKVGSIAYPCTGTVTLPPASFPGPSNTGYRNAPGYPGSLATYSGGAIKSNTAYSFLWFNGGVNVGTHGSPVSNVTFTGCRFTDSGESSAPAIVIATNGVRFSYCSFEPQPGFTPYQPPVSFANGYQIGISADGAYYGQAGGMIVEYCDLWGFAGGIDCAGSTQANPQIFRYNWIHDARQDGGIDHTDGLGATAGSVRSTYVQITGNTIMSAGNTNGLAFQRGPSTYDHMTITGNLFGGFGYTINIDGSAGGSSANMTFTDNTFSTLLKPAWGPLYSADFALSAGSVWRRNKWHVPAGSAWGTPAHDGWFWMPVAGSIGTGTDAPYVSQADYTG